MKNKAVKIKKEYCECCKKLVIPKKEKLQTGGDMSFCHSCGLALSVEMEKPTNPNFYVLWSREQLIKELCRLNQLLFDMLKVIKRK